MKKIWLELLEPLRARQKEERQDKRARRSAVFKLNAEKFGLDKAKLIAACVTRKRKGLWRTTEESAKRFRAYKAEAFWFAGKSWAGDDCDKCSV